MKAKYLVTLAVIGLGVALGYAAATDKFSPTRAVLADQKPAAADDKALEADREAIHKAARDFEKAFEKGDAKAVAAFWTADGEYRDPSGGLTRGRTEIEKVFAEFFKENPKPKIDILIQAIRFPAPDLAIEEGLLRQSGTGKELPTTTLYSVTHYRGKDGWKIAAVREWGAGQDRLEDLEWLVGTWKAKVKDEEATLTFTRDPKKPFLNGEFVRKSKDKVVTSGTMRIGMDPQRGQLRSWHFDDDGGHGQSLWLRDGNNWVLDSVGATGDGTDMASVNLLSRLSNNEIIWRSIDRVAGSQALPDTPPIKLSRVEGKK